jgi:hypothetical protein
MASLQLAPHAQLWGNHHSLCIRKGIKCPLPPVRVLACPYCRSRRRTGQRIEISRGGIPGNVEEVEVGGRDEQADEDDGLDRIQGRTRGHGNERTDHTCGGVGRSVKDVIGEGRGSTCYVEGLPMIGGTGTVEGPVYRKRDDNEDKSSVFARGANEWWSSTLEGLLIRP